MKRPLKFKIGDYVEASPVVFEYQGSDKAIVRSPDKIQGQIVGATYRMTGKYHSEGTSLGNWNDLPDYYAPYLDVRKSYLVWKIRQGYINKEVEALEEDIELMYGMFPSLPWKFRRFIK